MGIMIYSLTIMGNAGVYIIRSRFVTFRSSENTPAFGGLARVKAQGLRV